MYFNSVLKPAAYHGNSGKSPFFEGWYFKIVTANGSNCIAVIPGNFRGKDPLGHESFVMISDGSEGECRMYRFPSNAFQGSASVFDVSISGNTFSDKHLSLDLKDEKSGSVQAEIKFGDHLRWPESLRSPGIMGWYAWVPTMECYHGLVSLDGSIDGWMDIDGERIDFNGGRCYIEKDWGRNFPSSWIWVQSNHFGREKTCLTASIAKIPWKRSHFPGFIIGMLVDGELHRFATYTGANVDSLSVSESSIEWIISDKKKRLSIHIERKGGTMLWAPGAKTMELKVEESLDAKLVVLLETRDGNLIFEGEGKHAGLEVQGNSEELL